MGKLGEVADAVGVTGAEAGVPCSHAALHLAEQVLGLAGAGVFHQGLAEKILRLLVVPIVHRRDPRSQQGVGSPPRVGIVAADTGGEFPQRLDPLRRARGIRLVRLRTNGGLGEHDLVEHRPSRRIGLLRLFGGGLVDHCYLFGQIFNLTGECFRSSLTGRGALSCGGRWVATIDGLRPRTRGIPPPLKHLPDGRQLGLGELSIAPVQKLAGSGLRKGVLRLLEVALLQRPFAVGQPLMGSILLFYGGVDPAEITVESPAVFG